jgi:hypothetical protein
MGHFTRTCDRRHDLSRYFLALISWLAVASNSIECNVFQKDSLKLQDLQVLAKTASDNTVVNRLADCRVLCRENSPFVRRMGREGGAVNCETANFTCMSFTATYEVSFLKVVQSPAGSQQPAASPTAEPTDAPTANALTANTTNSTETPPPTSTPTSAPTAKATEIISRVSRLLGVCAIAAPTVLPTIPTSLSGTDAATPAVTTAAPLSDGTLCGDAKVYMELEELRGLEIALGWSKDGKFNFKEDAWTCKSCDADGCNSKFLICLSGIASSMRNDDTGTRAFAKLVTNESICQNPKESCVTYSYAYPNPQLDHRYPLPTATGQTSYATGGGCSLHSCTDLRKDAANAPLVAGCTQAWVAERDLKIDGSFDCDLQAFKCTQCESDRCNAIAPLADEALTSSALSSHDLSVCRGTAGAANLLLTAAAIWWLTPARR